MTTHTPCASDIWWTLDFASAFLSPGVNSRAELVYPRHPERRSAPLARGKLKKVDISLLSIKIFVEVSNIWKNGKRVLYIVLKVLLNEKMKKCIAISL
jgi:hypothetical protein